MRKTSLVLYALFITFSLTSCKGVSSGAESSNESSTEVISEAVDSNEVSLASMRMISDSGSIPDNALESSIVLDNDMVKKLKRYTTKYSTLYYKKSISTYSILGGVKNDETLISKQNFRVDLKNRITLTSLRTSTDNNIYYFADDNKNNIHTSRLNKGNYILDKNLESRLSFDYSKVKSSYDFLKYLMGGSFKMKNAEGYLEDGVYTFTFETEVNKSDLKGIDYDELGVSRLTLSLRDDGNNSLVPVSLSIENTFFVGQVEYGVSTDYRFTKFSDKGIKFPKYVKVEKLN